MLYLVASSSFVNSSVNVCACCKIIPQIASTKCEPTVRIEDIFNKIAHYFSKKWLRLSNLFHEIVVFGKKKAFELQNKELKICFQFVTSIRIQ